MLKRIFAVAVLGLAGAWAWSHTQAGGVKSGECGALIPKAARSAPRWSSSGVWRRNESAARQTEETLRYARRML